MEVEATAKDFKLLKEQSNEYIQGALCSFVQNAKKIPFSLIAMIDNALYTYRVAIHSKTLHALIDINSMGCMSWLRLKT